MKEAEFQRLKDSFLASAVVGVHPSLVEGIVVRALRGSESMKEYLAAFQKFAKPDGSSLGSVIGKGLSLHYPVLRFFQNESDCKVCGSVIPSNEKLFVSGGAIICRHCTVFMAVAIPKAKWQPVIKEGIAGHRRFCLFCASMSEICTPPSRHGASRRRV